MRLILAALVLLFIVGCSTVPVYQGPSSDQPSAILRFQSLEGLAGVGGCQAVFLEAVNGKSVSEWYAHWSITKYIRVNEGSNTIVVMGQSPDGKTKAYAELVFDAKAGENYLIKREDEVEDLHFMEIECLHRT